MHRLQFDLLDVYRRRLGLDNLQHHEMLLVTAQCHRRPLCQQKLFRAQGVLWRAVIERWKRWRYRPGFRNRSHSW